MMVEQDWNSGIFRFKLNSSALVRYCCDRTVGVYQSFIYEVANGIATVRLNNPEKLNALTFQTYEELERLFADLAHDNQVKVVIITARAKDFARGERARDYRQADRHERRRSIDSHG